MMDETGTDAQRAGFCQDCGRPLTAETARPVGSAMFCEPCLQVRLGDPAQATATGATGWTTTPPPSGNPGAVPPGTMPPGTMPPLGGDNPNPVLAGFLGLIPGVGAMYNGQFGKAIVHLVIFFLLQSMHRVELFGFLSFLWCLYQAYEAYHTALARRQGRPLPDPFGFNDLAERMGLFNHFHMPNSAQRPVTPPPPPFTSAGSQPTGYDASRAAYATPPPFVPPVPVDPAATAYGQPIGTWDPQPTAPAAAYEPVPTGYAAYPYVTPYAPIPVVAPTGLSRFPSLAIWLIGLGVVFLLLSLDSARWSFSHTVPFLLAALAFWLFARRMSATGGLLPAETQDGGHDEFYVGRLVHQLPLPGMLLVVSVLLGLDTYNLAYWDTTWPVLLIALGGFLLTQRMVRRPTPFVAGVPMPPYPVDGSATDTRKGGR